MMLYHACSYTHYCRMPYVCCNQWDAYCCLPRVRDPNTGALVSLANLTAIANGGTPLPDRIPAQQLRHLVSMWNMWYFWFMLIFLLFVCFGVCGAHKRRATWAAAAAAAAYRSEGSTRDNNNSGANSRYSAARRSMLLMDWTPRFNSGSGGRRERATPRLPGARSCESNDDEAAGVHRLPSSLAHPLPPMPLPPPPLPPMAAMSVVAPPPYMSWRKDDSGDAIQQIGCPPAYSVRDGDAIADEAADPAADSQQSQQPPPYRRYLSE